MQKSGWQRALATFAILLFLTGCSRTVEDVGQIGVLVNGEALRMDAEVYAKDQNVSVDEAIRRLELQGEIGKLDGELARNEPDTYAGLWIQHQPTFGVIVNMAGNSEKATEYTRVISFADLVEVREVAKSLRQLEADQSLAGDILQT
jgi:hypothetical protein